jgi:hypothetical protein
VLTGRPPTRCAALLIYGGRGQPLMRAPRVVLDDELASIVIYPRATRSLPAT